MGMAQASIHAPRRADTTTLPNFIIAGALKGGTTSLYYFLRQHPEVFMSSLKEPRYFAYEPDNPLHADGAGLHFPVKTLPEYAALFEAAVGGEKAIGEASPHYLISPVAPARIKELLPEVKLIFILRDPVKRANSVYWHSYRLGQEDRPIEQALTEEEYAVQHGLYYRYLRGWFDLFDPAQIKVILFDDFQRNALATFQDVCRFLGIDDQYVPDLAVRNKGGAPQHKRFGRLLERVKTHPIRQTIDPLVPKPLRRLLLDVRNRNLQETPPMPTELQQRLRAFYRHDVTELEHLLQWDLSSWKGEPRPADA